MNRLKTLVWLLVGSMAFASCDKTNNDVTEPESKAEFTSVVNSLRVNNDNWTTGDQVGIFALNTGQTIATGIYDGKVNIKYNAETNGVFTETETSIIFPKDGSALDFIAYYPYQDGIADGIYKVDVTNQSDLSKLDLIYSKNAKNKTKSTSKVDLTFDHQLALFEMNLKVVPGANISLEGATASFESILTTATFDLSTGALRPGTESEMNLVVNKISDSNARISMVLIPGTSLEEAQLKVVLGGKEYIWKPETMLIEAGKKYVVTTSVGTVEGEIKTVFGSSITDWDTENIDGGTLTPKDPGNNDSGSTPGGPDNGSGDSGDQGNGNDQPGNGGSDTPGTPSPTPGQAELLFAGADFENKTLFESQLAYKLKDFVSVATGGRNGGNALKIETKNLKDNDFVFTVKTSPKNFSGKKAITFYLKGTSNKTLSFEFFTADKDGSVFFGLATVSKDKTIEVGKGHKYANGKIDTQGKWVKITLDISGVSEKLGKGANLFTIKLGGGAPYNLLLDDFVIE